MSAVGKVWRGAWWVVKGFWCVAAVLFLLSAIFAPVFNGIAAGYHAAFGYPRGHLTRAALGERWPLTYDEVVLHCRNGDVLTLTLLAKDIEEGYSYELVSDPRPGDPIHEIWDESKALRSLLVRARELCDA